MGNVGDVENGRWWVEGMEIKGETGGEGGAIYLYRVNM